MIRTLSDASSLWLMRKHFALQTAANMFLSHIACLSNRTPGRFHLSLKTGLMYMSEVLPCKSTDGSMIRNDADVSSIAFDAAAPIHRCNEKVPFRLTPNMQHFITPTGIEGILTSSVIAMARSLSMPEFDLESCLTLFLRDEVSSLVTRGLKVANDGSCRFRFGSRCTTVRVITRCRYTQMSKAGSGGLPN